MGWSGMDWIWRGGRREAEAGRLGEGRLGYSGGGWAGCWRAGRQEEGLGVCGWSGWSVRIGGFFSFFFFSFAGVLWRVQEFVWVCAEARRKIHLRCFSAAAELFVPIVVAVLFCFFLAVRCPVCTYLCNSVSVRLRVHVLHPPGSLQRTREHAGDELAPVALFGRSLVFCRPAPACRAAGCCSPAATRRLGGASADSWH